MRFLANENYPLKSIELLREAGHDVGAIIEDSPGVDDRTILDRAVQEQRIVLTFDRDYGELIYRQQLSAPIGIVYFRFIPSTPEEPTEQLLKLLNISEVSIEEKFTVVERDRVRQRPLS